MRVFKTEADRYSDTEKFVFNPNGSLKHQSSLCDYYSEKNDYSNFEFWPFKDMDKLAELNCKANEAFSRNIIRYFNET